MALVSIRRIEASTGINDLRWLAHQMGVAMRTPSPWQRTLTGPGALCAPRYKSKGRFTCCPLLSDGTSHFHFGGLLSPRFVPRVGILCKLAAARRRFPNEIEFELSGDKFVNFCLKVADFFFFYFLKNKRKWASGSVSAISPEGAAIDPRGNRHGTSITASSTSHLLFLKQHFFK